MLRLFQISNLSNLSISKFFKLYLKKQAALNRAACFYYKDLRDY